MNEINGVGLIASNNPSLSNSLQSTYPLTILHALKKEEYIND